MRSLMSFSIEYYRNQIASSTSGDQFPAVVFTLSSSRKNDPLQKEFLIASPTRSHLISALIPENISTQGWTTYKSQWRLKFVQASKNWWPRPKPSAQAKTSCLQACYSPHFGWCLASFSQLFCLPKPFRESKVVLWTLTSHSIHTTSLLLTEYIDHQLQETRTVEKSYRKILF